MNDIWLFDLEAGTWTDASPAEGAVVPAKRSGHRMMQVPGTDLMITFGESGRGGGGRCLWAAQVLSCELAAAFART
jgi:hypothetical protein